MLWELASKISAYWKFNFLLSNGGCRFAYMNQYGTLHYLLRHPPHMGRVRLADEDFEIKLKHIKAGLQHGKEVLEEGVRNV